LAGETAVPESAFSSEIPATGMERLWSLAVATSGNRWQMHEPRNGSNKPKPLPPVATSCRSERMLRVPLPPHACRLLLALGIGGHALESSTAVRFGRRSRTRPRPAARGLDGRSRRDRPSRAYRRHPWIAPIGIGGAFIVSPTIGCVFAFALTRAQRLLLTRSGTSAAALRLEVSTRRALAISARCFRSADGSHGRPNPLRRGIHRSPSSLRFRLSWG
jgi:hypothetical protein